MIRKNLSSSHHGNVCKKWPCCSTNPKSVTPSSRVREFPVEHLRVSAGVLFCGACREEVSLKRSIIANHIASTKHKQSKLKLVKKESNIDALECWREHSDDLPCWSCWSAAVGKILFVQPSLAAAERVFSLLQNSFGSFQDAALTDYKL